MLKHSASACITAVKSIKFASQGLFSRCAALERYYLKVTGKSISMVVIYLTVIKTWIISRVLLLLYIPYVYAQCAIQSIKLQSLFFRNCLLILPFCH